MARYWPIIFSRKGGPSAEAYGNYLGSGRDIKHAYKGMRDRWLHLFSDSEYHVVVKFVEGRERPRNLYLVRTEIPINLRR